MSETTRVERREAAREELRRRLEGYMGDSIGAALDFLRRGSEGMARRAGLAGRSPEAVLRELTGVSA